MNDKHIYTINTNEAEVFLSVIYNPFLKSFKEKHPDIKVNKACLTSPPVCLN